MSLGLGSAITHGGISDSTPWAFTDPTSIPGVVGWWDFTDANSIYTDAGTTNVSSDGDSIYRIDNKITSSDRLGLYLQQMTSSKRPTYKTGGTNSKTYGMFDGSNDMLKCVYNPDYGGDGVVGNVYEDKLSSSSGMRLDNATIYFVTKCDIASPSLPATEVFLHMSGDDDNNDSNAMFIKMGKDVDSTADEQHVTFYTEGPETNGTGMEPSQAITTNTELWTIRLNEDSSSFYKNANTSNGVTGHDIGIEGKMRWNRSDTESVYVSLGAQTNSTGSATINAFDGNVYELIIVDTAVTDTENTAIENYLMTKYGL